MNISSRSKSCLIAEGYSTIGDIVFLSDCDLRRIKNLSENCVLEVRKAVRECLIEIWNDSNAFSYNRHFDCNMLTGYCKTCRYASVCKGGCTVAATAQEDGCRCNPYCLYKIEKDGFSSDEQAKTSFTPEEIAEIYNPLRKLPENFAKLYKP